jgi:transcriptional regulator with XRE-family HTH domain
VTATERKIIRYQNALAYTIRQVRTERGYSQERLAHEAGIDRSHMSRIERDRANPQFETLLKICDLLEISLTELVSRVESNLGLKPYRTP